MPQKSELQASKHQDGDVLVADLKSDLELMISDKQGLEKQFESSGKEVDELQTELEGLKAEKGKNESLLEKANSQQAQLLKKLETFQKDAEKSMVKKTTLASRREELQRKIREVGLLAEEALNSFSNLSSEELLRKLNAVNEDISGLKNVRQESFRKL